MTTIHSIPPLRGTRPDGAIPVRRKAPKQVFGWSPRRRSVLQAGTAVGLAALGMFPAARRAIADGYDIYPNCPSYAIDHNCSPGCGPSTIFADSCEVSGTNIGFHRNDGVNWTLRPNQCFASSYDGWLWRYNAACGACACGVERRCHDGYKRTSGGWVRSICRWNTQCGCLQSVSWKTVRRGDTGANVYTIQHLVTYHGFQTTADGIFGPNTEARVMDFEASRGLTVDGIVDAQTWPSLVVTIRRGDSNQAVRGGQRQLNKYAYGLVVDGIFGPATEAAALDFERQNGLTPDGVIGVSTWRTLEGGGGV
jgi:Putative peptidoglycan binding domain